MSNALAIAAVTTMLDYLISQAVARGGEEVNLESVTAKPLDKAREGGDSTNQINIFLYQTLPNAAWRNQDIPNRVKPGETGRPPLALTLSYLITAYGKGDDEIEGQRLLGMAMQSLHDQPEVHPRDIRRAIASVNLAPEKQELLTRSNLTNQVDRVRITPQLLSIEEISKMWATFQAPYRMSAAYEVSVVLIESSQPVKAPLPVLQRGSDDRGVAVQADLIAPMPTLQSMSWPSQREHGQVSLTLGERLLLKGHHLNHPDPPTALWLSHPLLEDPIQLDDFDSIASDVVQIQISDPAGATGADWVAGFYRVMLRYGRDGGDSFSNALPLAIAPTLAPPELSNNRLTISCTPLAHPGQPVSLLLGSREIAYSWDPEASKPLGSPDRPLVFSLKGMPAGQHFVRLRIDGVDSPLAIRSRVGTLQFDPGLLVTVPAAGP